jgi:hypothetical protein
MFKEIAMGKFKEIAMSKYEEDLIVARSQYITLMLRTEMSRDEIVKVLTELYGVDVAQEAAADVESEQDYEGSEDFEDIEF